MDFNEILLERKLHIDTAGRDESRSDEHHNPYQPTYYQILEWLRKSGYISSENSIVDYGCGKGRVIFYFCYYFGCRCVGIEREDNFYYDALGNKERFARYNKSKSQNIEFIKCDAEKYVPGSDADVIFFFNPFSLQITKAVLQRIKESYYENQRKIRLIFYYLMEDTEKYLSECDDLSLIHQENCMNMVSSHDRRHKINIYEIVY